MSERLQRLKPKSVVIGIQARSTSSRFPGKVFEMIGDKPMLRHVIDACDRSAFYINRTSHLTGTKVSHCILVPEGDEIRQRFGGRVPVIEGSEGDVLSRYVKMARALSPDYIVRVTGDCPLLPPFLVTKLITIAVANEYDYCSNVDPSYRTAVDGHDVEVLSKRALEWLSEHATDTADKEHVTTALRSAAFESQYKVGHVVNYLNYSHQKLSVDPLEDLERVRAEYDRVKRIVEAAEKKVGRSSVHRV